ncbi:hypothetical protein FRC09_011607, partial [Ceratobasidium sp. 395]
RFGDVDTSSVKAALASSFRGGKPAPTPASTTLPSAFGGGAKRSFAPPPVRRVPTNASSEGDAGDNPESRQHRALNEDLAPLRRMPSDRALREAASPEPQPIRGERAEALYDYASDVSTHPLVPLLLLFPKRYPNSIQAADDLNVRQGDKLIIVERTSDDWWTGEMNGRRGLLPASYVRIL